MSSCFLCDCSYVFGEDNKHYVIVPEGGPGTAQLDRKYMKQLPIMFGSPGNSTNDQQHIGMTRINYLSYRVKKIEFCCNYKARATYNNVYFPDYVLIFKVPLRTPFVNYDFGFIGDFMLYSEPESVLGFKVLQPVIGEELKQKYPWDIKIEINKPFIVGPRDYVGVFYIFGCDTVATVDASAKVWFDVV